MSSMRPYNFGKQHESDKTVDPHHYLLGRERPVAPDKEILGRRQGDSDQLFPRYAQASVTATGQYTVNGKTINMWTLAQLETLSQAVLRQRANAIRDAAGEANCPPLPSGQPQDLIHWIMHMQAELTQEPPRQSQRDGYPAQQAFGKDMKVGSAPLPFGPRKGQQHEGTRDNFAELLFGPSDEMSTPPVQGIVSMRAGGEGRRHLSGATNMESVGISGVAPKGIGSLRREGEGKKSIVCRDNLMDQKRELEAFERGEVPAVGAQRRGGQGGHHVSDTSMIQQGISAGGEAPIGGERRRHAEVPDRMENVGLANPGDAEGRLKGRRHLDSFGGAKFSCQDKQAGYQASWRKDPSNLRGQPMLI